jgi:hypothetical protein
MLSLPCLSAQHPIYVKDHWYLFAGGIWQVSWSTSKKVLELYTLCSSNLELHQQALRDDRPDDDQDQEAVSGPPITLEDLDRYLDRFTPPSGTSSILDVRYLISEAEYQTLPAPAWIPPSFGAFRFAYGAVIALSSEELIGVYGTERPTRALVEASLVASVNDGILSCCPRSWEGHYHVVYKDDIPNELFFFGRSRV